MLLPRALSPSIHDAASSPLARPPARCPQAYISAANMALKAGMAAAAVTEYETVRHWLAEGTVPPLSEALAQTLEKKLVAARTAAKGEYRI